MKVARITTAVALVATLVTPLAVSASPSTNGTEANGRSLTLANGQVLFLGSSGTGAPYEQETQGK